MADNPSQLTVPSVSVVDRVASLRIVLADGTVSVPMTANDNLLLSQVRVAQLREFMDTQIGGIRKSKAKMEPKDIKTLIEANAILEEMGRFAYAPGLNESEGGERAGQAAAQMAKAMAEGMTTAVIKSNAQDRQKKILELGKKKEPVSKIVEAEEWE